MLIEEYKELYRLLHEFPHDGHYAEVGDVIDLVRNVFRTRGMDPNEVLNPPEWDGDPESLKIPDMSKVIFVSSGVLGDTFVVLRTSQHLEGSGSPWRFWSEWKINLDWGCYDEAPKVVWL